MSVFRNLLMQSTGWLGKPSDWSDIRKDCPANSIALYAGVKSDYSQYDNLGFTATCVGGYNVFIDGTQYGTTYASGSQCSITWSTSGITTGDDITTPSALKAHKIWIEPATNGENITEFHCDRLADSGREAQGVLWAHFNISNVIKLTRGFARYNYYYNPLMESITAKDNLIKVSSFSNMLGMAQDRYQYAANLSYAPVFDLDGRSLSGEGTFNLLQTATLKKITLKNGNLGIGNLAPNASNLEKIITNNVNLSVASSNSSARSFINAYNLDELPAGIDYTNAVNLYDYITNAESLKDTVLDVRAATGLKRIGCYGSSQHFMGGFKGLRVSSSAPFDNATTPQINVSYTGMDRENLIRLFNDLPTVSAGQIVNITGCSGAADLTEEEALIPDGKGWTLTR